MHLTFWRDSLYLCTCIRRTLEGWPACLKMYSLAIHLISSFSSFKLTQIKWGLLFKDFLQRPDRNGIGQLRVFSIFFSNNGSDNMIASSIKDGRAKVLTFHTLVILFIHTLQVELKKVSRILCLLPSIAIRLLPKKQSSDCI